MEIALELSSIAILNDLFISTISLFPSIWAHPLIIYAMTIKPPTHIVIFSDVFIYKSLLL